MARPGITYQEVAAAADSIIAEGDNPTIQKIRSKLGTGSPNTIHRHLTAWRAAAPVKERKAPELPAGLQVALVQELERQAAEVRSELESKLIETQSEASELAETGEQLETDMNELKEQYQSISDECQRLEALAGERAKEIQKFETELSQERESAGKVQVRLAQALNKTETQAERITEQEGKLSKLEISFDEANQARIQAQQATAVCEAKFESSQREINQQTQRIERLEKDLEKGLADQKADFERRLSEQMADARRREQAFEAQVKEIRNEYQQRIEELKDELSRKSVELTQAQAEAARLRGRLEAKTEKRKETKKTVKA